MDLKKSIGSRITLSRKKLGVTIKELAEKSKSLSAARIGNWEQGTRRPGPEEAKILSEVLGVSPSYLLCLSNDPRGDLHLQSEVLPHYVPLLPLDEIIRSMKDVTTLKEKLSPYSDEVAKISLDRGMGIEVTENTFATTIVDTSLTPEFSPGDVVVAELNKKPNPGQYVIALIKKPNEVVIRKYRHAGVNSPQAEHFELVASNQDWGTISIKNKSDGLILATLVMHRRFL